MHSAEMAASEETAPCMCDVSNAVISVPHPDKLIVRQCSVAMPRCKLSDVEGFTASSCRSGAMEVIPSVLLVCDSV